MSLQDGAYRVNHDERGYSYRELKELSEQEADAAVGENWTTGEFDFDTYLEESILVGNITRADDADL